MASPLFLSYTWDDPSLEGADALELMLRLRGVPVWRDRRRMGWGDYKPEVVCEVIEELCCGFALHYTEPVLESAFIVQHELPAMNRRRRRDPDFFAGAIFRFGPLQEAAERLRATGGVEFGEPLGSKVTGDPADEGLRAAANDILARYLRVQLSGDELVRARVETRDDLPLEDPALLHLALSPPLGHDIGTLDSTVWTEQVQPALYDVRGALQDAGAARTLRVSGNLHLSAAIALGYEFREPTGWHLQLDRDGLSCCSERCAPDLDGWRRVVSTGGGATGEHLVVCVNATKTTGHAVDRHCADQAPAKVRIDITPPEGAPGKETVSAETVNALAAGIAHEVVAVRDRYGTRDTHLYLACPWPLAALLGWHLASCGRIVAHEATADRDTYRTSVVLT